jgi:hypothetical protein
MSTPEGSAMKEKSILFSTPMAQALLNTKPGVWPAEPVDPSKPYKWQTRRVINPQPLGKRIELALNYFTGKSNEEIEEVLEENRQ